MASKYKPLWVGKRLIKSGGGIYVFDDRMDSTNSSSIYLFDTYRDSMQQFQRDGLREFFETIKDLSLKESALKQYAKWLLSYGEQFASTHQIKLTLEELREYTRSLSAFYSSSEESDIYGGKRSAKCWRCHCGISSQSDVVCEKCHWIICNNCGACGCEIHERMD
jgi:hypothetical protein